MEMTTEIAVERVNLSRINEVDFDNIQFGRMFSDHQFLADFDGERWTNLRIVPYGPIEMSPAISAIHYGQAIFEGMKAYKDQNNNIRLFRPLDNWKRLNASAERMAMVQVPEEVFMDGLITLLKLDADWIPTNPGSALYIRPFLFATDHFIGVRPSTTYTFAIFTCPVNAYYQQPLKVKTETHFIRAAKGGVGFAKCAGNYGSVMHPTRLAQQEGYNQILWLDADKHEFLEETGTTNVFVRIGHQLITPSIENGTILRGITRDSVIKLAKSKGIEVIERNISIHELLKANSENNLLEVFAVGTAATLAKIQLISHENQHISFDNLDSWEYAKLISDNLEGIKLGHVPDDFGWSMIL